MQMMTTLAAWWKAGKGTFQVGRNRLRKQRFADGKDHLIYEVTFDDGQVGEFWSSGPIAFAHTLDSTPRTLEGETEE